MSLIKKIKFPNETIYDIGSKWSNIDQESQTYGFNNIINIDVDNKQLLKQCQIQIQPKQVGSGNPSPDNVQPVLGWDNIQIHVTGKNLLPPMGIEDYLDANIQWTVNEDKTFYSQGNGGSINSQPYQSEIDLPPGTYYLSGCPAGGGTNKKYFLRILRYQGDILLSSSTDIGNGINFTVSGEETRMVVFANHHTSITDRILWKPQIEFGDVATEYEPYGNTFSLSFSDKIGIVYGGTLNVLNGTLIVDRICKTLVGTDFQSRGSYLTSANDYRFYTTAAASENILYPPDSQTAADVLCSIATAIPHGDSNLYGISVNRADGRIYLHIQECGAMTLTEFRTWINNHNVQVAYKLTNPISYQLSSQVISILSGVNNIWTNCGKISFELEKFYSNLQNKITMNLNENKLLYKNTNSIVSSNHSITFDKLGINNEIVNDYNLYVNGSTLITGSLKVNTITDLTGLNVHGALTIIRNSNANKTIQAAIIKNASDTADYGTQIVDYNTNDISQYTRLIIRDAAGNLNKSLYILDESGEVKYIYGEHNKPTPADIGAASFSSTPVDNKIVIADGVNGLIKTINTIAINQGGTGGTTANNARNNLEVLHKASRAYLNNDVIYYIPLATTLSTSSWSYIHGHILGNDRTRPVTIRFSCTWNESGIAQEMSYVDLFKSLSLFQIITDANKKPYLAVQFTNQFKEVQVFAYWANSDGTTNIAESMTSTIPEGTLTTTNFTRREINTAGLTVDSGYLTIKPYSSTYDTTGTNAGIKFYFNHNRSGYNTDTLITGSSLQATNFYGALKGNADTATAANITSTANAIARYSNTTGTFANSYVAIDNNAYIWLQTIAISRYKNIYFQATGSTTATTGGLLQYDTGTAGKLTSGYGRFNFFQFSPKGDNTANNSGYYEAYQLPTVTAELTANRTYEILTTKNCVKTIHYYNTSAVSTAHWITTNIIASNTGTVWVRGRIFGSKGTDSPAFVVFSAAFVKINASDPLDGTSSVTFKYWDPLGLLSSFSASFDSNRKIYFSFKYSTRYSRIEAIINHDTTTANEIASISTTVPTVVATYAGTKVTS